MPVDAIEMPAVLRKIEKAAANATPFVISTPNLNYLVITQQDSEFRESLLMSDLCPTDGMPIVWIARLMGIPITHRTAGSDMFDALRSRPNAARHLKVFLFGDTEDVAAAAAKSLNEPPTALSCAGWLCPDIGAVDELSQEQFINKINSSNADFLVTSLGSRKGQLWLQRNHQHLRIPVRTHLGATIKFQSGTVQRAPHALRVSGLEWLWRIKEEPRLWSRYLSDALVLLRMMFTRVMPLALAARSLQRRGRHERHDLVIERVNGSNAVTLRLAGFAVASQAEKAISCFREAVTRNKQVVLDLAQTRAVDARFLGLLLMVRKDLKVRGGSLHLVGVSRRMRRTLRLNGLEFLLPDSGPA
jgi:N-acetylglucosaminyldiphosphoundecaprenol N-acetyl-beta-D-mannosaminyltransferase